MTSALDVAPEPLARYAQVAVPVYLNKLFTYRLPPAIQRSARVGARVIVQLGTKSHTGYIVALLPRLRPGSSLIESEIKQVQELLDVEPPVTAEILELTRWVSEYYAAPWGEVLRAALPAGINATVEQTISITQSGREHLQLSHVDGDNKSIRALRILADEPEIELGAFRLRMGASRTPKWLIDLENTDLVQRSYRTISSATRAKRVKAVRLSRAPLPSVALTETQRRVLEILQSNQNEMAVRELTRVAGVTDSVIRALVTKGIFEEFEQQVRRDPLVRAHLPPTENFELNAAQTEALQTIRTAARDEGFAAMLLHGVTGSGKTEVYLRAMRAVLDMNRGGLMLVPEIALTPILSRRLRAHFGSEIAILHSSLSRGERFDEWSRLRSGEARLALGTRSAVFAPVQNLGLIVVDEEHDTSYRQEESPFYNARDTAIVRGQKEAAVVILGSATPSLESFHNAENGKYRYLQLPERVADRLMARSEIVDMRAVFARRRRPAILSEELLDAIAQTHARGEQTIILINRRGYSSFILCRSCGESIMCPNCEVTLTYHRSDRTLVCHYCNHRQRSPSQCPVCASKYIYYVGEGTEQIEDVLRQHFPRLKIGRIDRDTKARRHEFEETLIDFGKGDIDLLVGTQMLAKGHDFHNVTLVGVVSVDAGLALPDFRAAERTFQLITQVAGRAGRGDKPGRVLIQSYHPEHYALRHAAAQDFQGFYQQEIRHRRNHAYPPFVALAMMLVRHKDPAKAAAIAKDLRAALLAANADNVCRILGPAPAPLARLRGEHRIQILVKCRSRKQLRKMIENALEALEAQGKESKPITVEIDPISMM